MSQLALDNPHWVYALLRSPLARFLVRLAFVSSYLVGGFTKLLDFQSATAEQLHFGLQPPAVWAAMAIIIEIGGSALILIDRFVWLAAGALGVLTAIAMLVANNFWAMEGHARFLAMNSFFEHLGLIAGFAAITLLAGVRTPPRSTE